MLKVRGALLQVAGTETMFKAVYDRGVAYTIRSIPSDHFHAPPPSAARYLVRAALAVSYTASAVSHTVASLTVVCFALAFLSPPMSAV